MSYDLYCVFDIKRKSKRKKIDEVLGESILGVVNDLDTTDWSGREEDKGYRLSCYDFGSKFVKDKSIDLFVEFAKRLKTLSDDLVFSFRCDIDYEGGGYCTTSSIVCEFDGNTIVHKDYDGYDGGLGFNRLLEVMMYEGDYNCIEDITWEQFNEYFTFDPAILTKEDFDNDLIRDEEDDDFGSYYGVRNYYLISEVEFVNELPWNILEQTLD